MFHIEKPKLMKEDKGYHPTDKYYLIPVLIKLPLLPEEVEAIHIKLNDLLVVLHKKEK